MKDLSRALLDTHTIIVIIDGVEYTATVSGVSVLRLLTTETINLTITDTTKEVPM